MSGHDHFPEAKATVYPPTHVTVYPGVTVDTDETYAVVEKTEGVEGASLFVIVASAWDHHGNDVRELVAQRIAAGLAQ